MNTEVSRKILAWFARFDVVAALQAGLETTLNRDWFVACLEWQKQQAEQNPDDLICKIDVWLATNRIAAKDMAGMFAKLQKGLIDFNDFSMQAQEMSQRIHELCYGIDPALFDPRYEVHDYATPENSTEIVKPNAPGGFFSGPLWTMNLVQIDAYAFDLMFKYQMALTMQQPMPADLPDLALCQCQMIKAIEVWPHSLPGAHLAAAVSLGIASLFLPKDEQYTLWCRRKLAKVEQSG